jgi:hypothetical protein
MRNLVNEPIEDNNSSSVKGLDLNHQPLSESIDRGDGYVIFSPKDPEVGGTDIVLKWGGNPPEKNKQQQKDKGEKGKDQNKDKEKGEKGEKGGEGEQDQSGQEEAGSEGTEGTGRGKEGGKEKGTQSDQKGGGKGKEKGEEEGGESGGNSGEGNEKEGEEKDGERGRGQGGEKGDRGKDKDGGEGGELGDLGNIRGQDILGGGRNRGEPDDDEDEEDNRPRRPPHGPRKKDKRGKDKEGRDKSREPGEPGEPTDPEDDDTVVEVSSDITDVPPASEEEDPRVLDVIFGKDNKEVSEKENKVIHKSFVFRSGNESIEVFQITPKGRFSVGDRTYVKKLANLGLLPLRALPQGPRRRLGPWCTCHFLSHFFQGPSF